MVNMKAINKAEAGRADRQRESTYKRVRHRQVWFKYPQDGSRSKSKNRVGARKKSEKRVSEPLNFRFPLGGLYFYAVYHKFDGGELLRRPYLCSKAHYDGEKCKVCIRKDANGKPGRYSEGRVYLVLNLDRIGETYERDGVEYLCNPYELLFVDPGEGDINWKTMDDFAEKGYLDKKVIQFQCVGYQTSKPVVMMQEEVDEEYGGGHPPKDIRTKEVRSYSEDDFFGHALLLFDNVDFDYLGVDEPDVTQDEELEAPQKKRGSGKPRRHSEENPEDDNDDDESPRSRRRKYEDEEDDDETPKKPRSRKQPSDVESSDDDDGDSSDEEDDETPPRHRRR